MSDKNLLPSDSRSSVFDLCQKPDVSIIISAYNRAHLVCDAVQSCLDQKNCSMEVIVIDDGSTDDTKGALQKTFRSHFIGEGHVSDGRLNVPVIPVSDSTLSPLRYCYQSNQGMSPALNTGLQRARGEYVKFLDSDDVLMPGALCQEVAFGREEGVDVVVTGRESRTYDSSGNELGNRRCRIDAPDMGRGVDDMLIGHAPWTASALYRREFIASLRWNTEIVKGRDWAWSWTVCLAGATYAMLPIASAVWKHHEGERITSDGDPLLRSTLARQSILQEVERELRSQGQLTEERCKKLAQYYYKDRVVLCQYSLDMWKELWRRCQGLAPGFVPHESSRLIRCFVRGLGVQRGIMAYVLFKRIFIRLSEKRKDASEANR